MDKMKMESANLTDRNIEKIAALFPNCISETADENGRLKKAVNFEIPKDLKVIADKRIADEDVSWSPLRNWGSESKRSDAKNCFYPSLFRTMRSSGLEMFLPMIINRSRPCLKAINTMFIQLIFKASNVNGGMQDNLSKVSGVCFGSKNSERL